MAKRRALRPGRHEFPSLVDPPHHDPTIAEPGLHAALRHLSGRQRAVVYLVEGLGMTHRETANLLGVSRSSVQTHLERALRRLRIELGVPNAI